MSAEKFCAFLDEPAAGSVLGLSRHLLELPSRRES